jgi:hypothetical protein
VEAGLGHCLSIADILQLSLWAPVYERWLEFKELRLSDPLKYNSFGVTLPQMTEYVDHFVGETRRLIDSGFESAQCAVTDFKNFDTGGLFDPEEAKKYGVETNFVKGVQPWEQLFAISVLAQGFLWLRRSPHSINLMV